MEGTCEQFYSSPLCLQQINRKEKEKGVRRLKDECMAAYKYAVRWDGAILTFLNLSAMENGDLFI